MNEYDVGDVVRVAGSFLNAAGVPTDPSVVQFKFKNPAGTVTTYIYSTDVQLVKDATGYYHVDIDANDNGVFQYRLYSTGNGQAAHEGSFSVRDSNF